MEGMFVLTQGKTVMVLLKNVNTSGLQFIKDQRITDDKLLALVDTMNDTLTFAKSLNDIEQIKIVEKIVTRILQQTAECAFFIREYAQRNFVGKLLLRVPKFMVPYKDPERVAQQLWKDPTTKIGEFTEAFRQLRVDLDTGTLQQNTIVTSRISEGVDVLGIPITFPTQASHLT